MIIQFFILTTFKLRWV